jgi:hypothetical protein
MFAFNNIKRYAAADKGKPCTFGAFSGTADA